MIGTLGASAALAGLVLVFLGVLVTGFQTLLGDASAKTLGRFRNASLGSLVTFGLSMVSVIISAAWLVAGGGHCFYVATVAIFFAQLVGIGVLAYASTVHVLLKG